MKKNEPLTISVFSEILSDRDYLRRHIIASGLNAVCFEKENVCIDNLESINPHAVLIHTESAECVWRFLWAIHFSGVETILIVDSEHLTVEAFKDTGLDIPVHVISHHNNGDFTVPHIQPLRWRRGGSRCGSIRSLLVGEAVDIQQIRVMLPNISESFDPVLILGEKGVGKEHLARTIFEHSNDNPGFVKIDCQAFNPGALVNGAMKKIQTLKTKTECVTILLDKIHLATGEGQADILLLVDEAQKIQNGNGSIPVVETRLIATAENGLETMVQEGVFRKDLYYRINVIPIRIPPLRERRIDIPLLMDYFMIEACTRNNKCTVIPSKSAKELLSLYDWPGNIGELKRYMYRVADDGHEGCLMNNDSFQNNSQCWGESLFRTEGALGLPKPQEIKDYIPKLESLSLRGICDEFVSRTERRLLKKALEKTNWNRKNAASLLNISYKSMLNKMKVYDII